MKFQRKVFLALMPAAMFALTAMAQTATQAPMKLKHTEPATSWEEEALPIGNGYMGAMIFGGVDIERIQVNEHTLWSGGPGEDVNYNGGHNASAAQNHKNLMTVQRLLQDEMNEFSSTKAAKVTTTGTPQTNNYANSGQVITLTNSLKGTKNKFGSFMGLSDIKISNLDAAVAQVDNTSITSTSDNVKNAGETVKALFDGQVGTKYFADNDSYRLPLTVEWAYNKPIDAGSYTIVSGNDMPGRDPKAWVLYGSVDGVNFEQIDQRDGNFWGDDRRKAVTFEMNPAPAKSYQYFRWVISATMQSGQHIQASEFTMNVKEESLPTITEYAHVLDIDNALQTVDYKANGVGYHREYFMSYPDNVMVVRMTTDAGHTLNYNVAITTQQQKVTITSDAEQGYVQMTGYPVGTLQSQLNAGKAMLFAQKVQVRLPQGGKIAGDGKSLDITGAPEIVLVMSAATNYKSSETTGAFDFFDGSQPIDKVNATLAAVDDATYNILKATHIADYKNLYDRNKIAFGKTTIAEPAYSTPVLLDRLDAGTITDDERLYVETLYYQFGRYLLISSSRPGSLPANLQGVWADSLHPAWDADYHTNINVQMNYWLAQQTNLSECHVPMIDYIRMLAAYGRTTATHYYCKPDGGEVRGWTTGHECNIWGNTSPGTSSASFFPSGGAWLSQDIWEYYQFTQDRQFLADHYQVLLDASLFWVDFLWRDERDGTLVANPSWSPEHGEFSLGCSTMQAMTWELFDFTIKAAEILGKDDAPEIAEIRESLARLAGPQIGLGGQFMEWKDEVTRDINGDGGHRHTNHLFWLHPGSQIIYGRDIQDNAYGEAMKMTLRTRGDESTGWSMAWKMNFWARLHDGDHARRVFSRALHHTTNASGRGGVYSNMFDAHPPFQIDGNFGATAGVAEMLIQSQGGYIELLPALPTAWADGSFTGMKARGNFEVSCNWANKAVTEATVKSLVGGTCVVKYPGIGAKTVEGATVTKISNDMISFETTEGQTYTIR